MLSGCAVLYRVAADGGAAASYGFYACVICVRKKNLYPSVKAIQKVCCCTGQHTSVLQCESSMGHLQQRVSLVRRRQTQRLRFVNVLTQHSNCPSSA
jgi:hypothetical protein